MDNQEKKERLCSYLSPVVVAASLVGGLITAASLLTIMFPSVAKPLPYINLGIIFIAIFINLHALSLMQEKEREIDEKSLARERTMKEALLRAESSDKARQAIIANMSHEFRTPLNSVIGFAELLAEGETDQERAEMARCVQRGGWDLLELVNSLIKTAELSNGDARTNAVVPFTLEELAEAVGAEHEKEIRGKGLRFKSRWEGNRLLVGNLEAISAVMGILVSNAVKYSDAGTIELQARELSVNDGNRVTIECVVSDQGRGMDLDTMGKLFHPFEQG
ncbi:MAG: HAMP domain-containing sensor histidine kinase, partial [Treponemataceae bacterium]